MSTTGSYLISGGNEKLRLEKALSISQFPEYSENNPDLIFVSGSETNISIGKIRDIQKVLVIKPVGHAFKTAIINHAEKLTVEAQNSFLKILEEPPENTIIILLAENEDLLLPTIISRCRHIRLPNSLAQLTETETKSLRELFQKIPAMTLGEKFRLAAEISKDRQAAIVWLDHLLIICHHQAGQQDKINLPKLTRAIFEAKMKLQANGNVRLTIENLLLKW